MIELVHVHVPKCGGMAFRSAIEKVYGERVIGMPITNTLEMARAALEERLVDLGQKDMRGYIHGRWAVTGHAPARGLVAVDALHVAIVRDPLERLISWRHFSHVERDEDFEAMLRSSEAGMHRWTLDNVFVRFFAGLPFGVEAPRVTAADVDVAVERASHPLFQIFTIDQLLQAVIFCAQALDWSLLPEPSITNVRPGQALPAPERDYDVFPAKLRALAQPLVVHDYDLFRRLEIDL